MTAPKPTLHSLSHAIEDHSPEGVDILTSEPSRFAIGTIYLLFSLVFVWGIWSFFGRSDVIVTTPGVLSPEATIRRVYAPVKGELVDIYISEGAPVAKDDVLARINARDAVALASKAMEAQLKLSEAEREMKLFPIQKRLLERKVAAIKAKLEIEEEKHKIRVADGLEKLAGSHRKQLAKEESVLKNAAQVRDAAKKNWERFQRLFNSPGGGGISLKQVNEEKSKYRNAQANFEQAAAKLNELEEKLNGEYFRLSEEIKLGSTKLEEARVNYETSLNAIESNEHKVKVKLEAARLELEASKRITFDNIDEDGFLVIKAPVGGVVASIAYTQSGDKVESNRPMADIVPEQSGSVLHIDIPENNRAFIKVGQPVKMKFNAFAFQRYGFISGTLQYIAPSTVISPATKKPVYKGRVSLDRDYYEVDGVKMPLRYGMVAAAEIVTHKRRLIDLALDPFRRLKR
ncbi:HlyD family efflux transporter periplasmic adaptor subunit [Alkalimarinus coralli]|uniref:HlyD family efflux transporter periplasmic adaptor subunit n=1 Tax=Alkalimarinus coralli TaxID=2935863 RepID=UPI00202B1FBC|nr:HlyD family efflux transporter periplasmic adaptor subunit [Alkalimarinus coralli]